MDLECQTPFLWGMLSLILITVLMALPWFMLLFLRANFPLIHASKWREKDLYSFLFFPYQMPDEPE